MLGGVVNFVTSAAGAVINKGKDLISENKERLKMTKDGIKGSLKDNLTEAGMGLADRLLRRGLDPSQPDPLYNYLSRNLAQYNEFRVINSKGFDLRALMGAPFKFSRTDDPPVGVGSQEYGRCYLENFIEWGNIVSFSPGVAYFLPSFSDKEKRAFLADITNSNNLSMEEKAQNEEETKGLLREKDAKRVFGFRAASKLYWQYVNMIWKHLMICTGLNKYESRIAAYYGAKAELGTDIGQTIKGVRNLGDIQWGNVNRSSDLNKIMYSYIAAGADLSHPDAQYTFVPFYNDGPFNSGFGVDNSTGESQVLNFVNQIPGDELAKEIGFFTGIRYGDVNAFDVKAKDQSSPDDNNMIRKLFSFKKLGVKTILPDVWKDSGSTAREQTFTFRLGCADGSPEAYAIHSLRPLAHLLSFALPIHTEGNFGFSAPLLCRVFAKGMSNIDIGVVTRLDIQLDPKSITTYGLMSDMTVTMTVKDLTPVIALPNSPLGKDATSAVGYLSIIGGLSGVNTHLMDWTKFADLNISTPITTFFSTGNIMQSVQGVARDTLSVIKAKFWG